ncbi:MAG: molecular chaperone TorD family protein [Vibrio sp.]
MTNFYIDAAAISRVLGAILYFRPSDYQTHGIDQVFSFQAPEESPLLSKFEELMQQFQQADIEVLNEVHDEFFAGIADMPAPPWGSVYLDRECVLFGESTTEYKQFLVEHGFEFETQNNDPLDHVGLMMMTLGELLEEQVPNEPTSVALNELLSHHMLPWMNYYFSHVLNLVENQTYYNTLLFTVTLLEMVKEKLAIQAKPRKIYFQIADAE